MKPQLIQKQQSYPTTKTLMNRILEARYTDLELERELCNQLLDAASIAQDFYAWAFANVYMMDSLLALGDNASCGYYLARASALCREHHYDGLLLMLCNTAGLYFAKLGDEQSAIQYYLEGLRLARQRGDTELECKLLNNTGAIFAGREDWSSAKEYFARACVVAESCDHLLPSIVSYLCNLGEVCKNLGDYEAARHAFCRCKLHHSQGLYHEIRLTCAWCGYYASTNEKEKCLLAEAHLRSIHFLDYENKYFIYDICIGISGDMLDIGEDNRAGEYLRLLESVDSHLPLFTRFRVLQLRIRYWERLGNPEELDKSYCKYYELEQQMRVLDDQAKAESMLSRIQMMKVRMERETMRSENCALEHASQLDDLTGLYNRRYFNKLLSKVTQGTQLTRLGVLMVDVDFFKEYNDHYGHILGDQALKTTADSLVQNALPNIYVSRYGGDEFACLCVNMSDEEIEAFLAAIDSALLRRRIPHAYSSCSKWLSVFIGWCNEPFGPERSPSELLSLADQALYQAKANGRGRHERKRL